MWGVCLAARAEDPYADAQQLLWDGRYREAEQRFRALLSEHPADPNFLLGYAQAAYWSGDFRAAKTRYERLLAVVADHAEAAKVLSDLAIVMASRYAITGTHLDDSQPYRYSAMRVAFSQFLDPLTRIDLRGSVGDAAGAARRVLSAGAGISAGLPQLRLHVDAAAEWFRFPDGQSDVIGDLAITARLPQKSAIRLSAERTPLLRNAVSVDDHATVTRYSLGWQRDLTERWLAAITVHSLRYSDDNSGSGADAWVLVPVYSTERFMVRAGLSAAVRDTEENRFRFTEFESEQIGPSEWRYRYTGVYDPYWTPHDLTEGRVIMTAEWPRLKLHADGGHARDRALGFGPPTGATPNPLFIFPEMQDRSFRPWRVGAEWNWPLRSGVELRITARHDVTAFYRANEFQASLGGRL